MTLNSPTTVTEHTINVVSALFFQCLVKEAVCALDRTMMLQMQEICNLDHVIIMTLSLW